MDVFGSSPVSKLNNLIRDINQHFERNLDVHRVLIDSYSEKINVLTANTEVLKKKCDTQFASMEVLSENINALTAERRSLQDLKIQVIRVLR